MVLSSCIIVQLLMLIIHIVMVVDGDVIIMVIIPWLFILVHDHYPLVSLFPGLVASLLSQSLSPSIIILIWLKWLERFAI